MRSGDAPIRDAGMEGIGRHDLNAKPEIRRRPPQPSLAGRKPGTTEYSAQPAVARVTPALTDSGALRQLSSEPFVKARWVGWVSESARGIGKTLTYPRRNLSELEGSQRVVPTIPGHPFSIWALGGVE
jgi:hypothetical protein